MGQRKGPPVAEMIACSNACGSWLEINGYCRPFEEGETYADAQEGILFRLNQRPELDEEVRARKVRDIFLWFRLHVLPVFDGRRDAMRDQLEGTAPSPGLEAPALAARLFFGDDHSKLGERVRTVLDKAKALSRDVQKLEELRSQGTEKFGQQYSGKLEETHRVWCQVGEHLLTLLLPVGTAGITTWPVPQSPRDWTRAREMLEGHLRAVEFTDAEVLELLPLGGSKTMLRQRRLRARKRAPG